MKRSLFASMFFALLVSVAPAALLPPVDPILDGTDHSFEDHSGHNHWNTAAVNGANFTGASFRGGLVRNNFISNSVFIGTDFREVDFDDNYFYQCDLRGANFSGSSLSELTIDHSDLRGAIFHEGASTKLIFGGFYYSNLSGTDLNGFDLRGANFKGSDMRGVDLRGANLRYPSNQPDYDLDKLTDVMWDATTIYDAQTVFPVLFDPVAAGLTFVPEPSSWVLAIIGVVVLMAGRRFRR